MKIQYLNHFEEIGCVFDGNLAVIDYMEYRTTLTNYGKFGGMSFFDALDDAKKVMFDAHPSAKFCLGIPVLVCEI